MPILELFTENFLQNLLLEEVKELTGKKAKKEKDYLLLEVSEEELQKSLSQLYFKSRFCQNIFLKEKKMDVFGFSLQERKLLHKQSPFSVAQRILFFAELEIPKGETLSCIDPKAEYGELILEAASWMRDSFLHERARFETPAFRELKLSLQVSNKEKNKSKLQAICQENQELRYLKENAEALMEKVSSSQYDFDWLDVKWQEDNFDYALTELYEDELEEVQLEELLYQMEFLSKKMGILSNFKIPNKVLKKAKLKKDKELACEGAFITTFK
jgi:hypothetical protein